MSVGQSNQDSKLWNQVEGSLETVKSKISQGTDKKAVLAELVGLAEELAGPGCVSSILVIDSKGLLRNGCSPNLPSDYLAAIDNLKPDANVGTCASAAATGQTVFTPDFFADDKWAELRQLPLGLGYLGAWSMPIKNPTGKVLGTFGTYFREKRMPSEREQKGIALLVQAAALAIS